VTVLRVAALMERCRGGRAGRLLKLLAIACSFSMVGVCTALALSGGTNPLTLVTLRALGTLLVLLAYVRLAGVPLKLSVRDYKLATAIAILLCINTYCINEAIARMPVPLAVLIFYLWPAIVAATSWITGTERFRRSGMFGLACAFVGIALALNADFGSTQSAGAMLALVSAFAWAALFLLTHRFFPRRDTRPIVIYMTIFSFVVFVAITSAAHAWRLPTLPVGWLGITGVTLFYALGTIGIFAATAHDGPMRTGFFMNFEPVATVLLSALILDQRLAAVQLVGAALVIAALFLFRPPPRAQLQGAPPGGRSL
jgi:drug/metabolite transporter (DMT)-like permease